MERHSELPPAYLTISHVGLLGLSLPSSSEEELVLLSDLVSLLHRKCSSHFATFVLWFRELYFSRWGSLFSQYFLFLFYFLQLKKIYLLFTYLAAPGLSCGMWDLLVVACEFLLWTLICGLWDLVPWSGIEPGPPALGAWSLSHWPTREVPILYNF